MNTVIDQNFQIDYGPGATFRIGSKVQLAHTDAPWPNIPPAALGVITAIIVSSKAPQSERPFEVTFDLATFNCTLGSLYPHLFTGECASKANPDERILTLQMGVAAADIYVVLPGRGSSFVELARAHIECEFDRAARTFGSGYLARLLQQLAQEEGVPEQVQP